MEQGVTRPPSSPPQAASSQTQGVGSLLLGPSIGKCMSKCLRAEGGLPSGLSQQPPPTQVTSNREGEGMPSCPASSRIVGCRGHGILVLCWGIQALPQEGPYQGLYTTIYLVRACGMPWAISVAYHFLCLSFEFDSFLNRKHTLGDLSFHRSTA
jgi:hypothetical protein